MARTRADLRTALTALRGRGRLALVPTMGYLHPGHLSLVELARRNAESVAVSIFVNPLQFAPTEDYSSYPRDEARDLSLLEARGVELVFSPTVEEMYPDGAPSVTVDPGAMGERLCGAYRPGHFRGVLTVVARLFGLFHPQCAAFGRKDYQQAVLIRSMVRDLEMGPLEVLLAATTRERDGLAMSSRNAYLSPAEREQAVGLFRALEEARARFAAGERSASALRAAMRARLGEHPLLQPQYVELVDPDTLESVERAEAGSVAALAAFCGRTRLIDNGSLA